MNQLFGPSSPPSIFDPSDFMSPGKGNIWGSPSMPLPSQQTRPAPATVPRVVAKPKSRATEDQLKAMLNIGAGGVDNSQQPPLEVSLGKTSFNASESKSNATEDKLKSLLQIGGGGGEVKSSPPVEVSS